MAESRMCVPLLTFVNSSSLQFRTVITGSGSPLGAMRICLLGILQLRLLIEPTRALEFRI